MTFTLTINGRERRRAADRFTAAEHHPSGKVPEQARKGSGKAAAPCTRCAGKARSGARSRSRRESGARSR